MIVCDTGPLVAVSNERDEHYFAANSLFRDLHMAGETILIPSTVVAETCYWLNKHSGPAVEASFLDALADGSFTLVDLTTHDIVRMAELVRTFAAFPLGATDASVIAVAERLGAHEIATFDRRHFPAITPKSGGHFTLLPAAL
jgi:predicted nucleic acid-binding protein